MPPPNLKLETPGGEREIKCIIPTCEDPIIDPIRSMCWGHWICVKPALRDKIAACNISTEEMKIDYPRWRLLMFVAIGWVCRNCGIEDAKTMADARDARVYLKQRGEL